MTSGKRKTVGRPLVHTTSEQKKTANAVAARLYRARQRAKKAERRDLSKPLESSIIDLSELRTLWWR